MSTIEITDIGAVEQVTIPCPADGGFVVLKADNGKGKSTTLQAIESALTGRGSLSVRDRALKGQVEAFGVTVTVGKSTRHKGELTVTSLDGKLSIGELIDPGLKSPLAADAKRIKALLALVGAEADAQHFYRLFGGKEEFERTVSAATAKCDDLVTMAEKIKRDAEAKARTEEDSAEKAEGRATGSKNAAGDIDQSAECDASKLQAKLESAVRYESSLQAKADASFDAETMRRKAKEQLATAESLHGADTVTQATKAESEASAEIEDAARLVATREQSLQEAKDALASARSVHEAAIKKMDAAAAARKSAERHAATLQQWRDQLAAAVPDAPSQDELDAAADAVTLARKALEQGAVVRRAKEHLAEHAKALADASAHRKRAAALREAAKGTDEVLSELVGRLGTPLRVEAGRLVTDTSRGDTYFHELSDGERAKMSLNIGIDAAGPQAVIVFPQQQFEGLSPKNRKALADHARSRGAVVITALATDDDEIVAEVM